MRYIVLLIWTLLLAQLVTYVVSSMTNVAYNFNEGVIFGFILWALLAVISYVIPDKSAQEN